MEFIKKNNNVMDNKQNPEWWLQQLKRHANAIPEHTGENIVVTLYLTSNAFFAATNKVGMAKPGDLAAQQSACIITYNATNDDWTFTTNKREYKIPESNRALSLFAKFWSKNYCVTITEFNQANNTEQLIAERIYRKQVQMKEYLVFAIMGLCAIIAFLFFFQFYHFMVNKNHNNGEKSTVISDGPPAVDSGPERLPTTVGSQEVKYEQSS